MEKIADVLGLRYPQYNTVSSDCFVSDALYQMCCEKVDHLVVFDSEKFIGIITDNDIASKVLYDTRPLNKIMVKEFVNTTLPVASPSDSIGQCLQLMERYHSKHIAVFDNDNFDFRGVLSIHDLMQKGYSKPNLVFEEADSVRHGYPWTY
ncbi:MAG TPA: CBS domain-containing protein [Flavisolibacter sp.]|nr:CBS domain-containing protein [Flavisolibacter sp.]